MREEPSDAMLRTLQMRGAIVIEEPDNLLNILKEKLVEEYHISYGYSGRRVRHFHAPSSLKEILKKDKVWHLLQTYFGREPEIIRVQQIDCGENVTRTQLVHRDHDLGPKILVALAISDQNLNTVVFNEKVSSAIHDNSKYTRLCSRCGIFDTYFFHRGAACIHPTKYRYFIHIRRSDMMAEDITRLDEYVT